VDWVFHRTVPEFGRIHHGILHQIVSVHVSLIRPYPYSVEMTLAAPHAAVIILMVQQTPRREFHRRTPINGMIYLLHLGDDSFRILIQTEQIMCLVMDRHQIVL
jgi:hypothetical protein